MNPKNILLVAGVLAVLAAKTQAGELIVNGGFETGDFTGWETFNQAGGSGDVYNTSGTSSPISGFTTVGAAGGNQYAITDQGGPGSHVLRQSFTVAPGSTTQLAFEMFVNDQNGAGAILGPGLDSASGPNQHVQVDILAGGSDAFDTGAGVLANYYLGVDAGGNPHDYTSYSFDISSIVAAGGTYQVRFAEVDNQYFLQMGVDDVSVKTSSVPDAGSTFGCLALGVMGLFSFRRVTRAS